MSNEKDFWSDLDVEMTPFFKWGSVNQMLLELTTPIQQYKVEEISGQFGMSKYIAAHCNGELCMFKVDSVRLRKALVEVCDSADVYPIAIKVSRTGSGFQTEYTAELVKQTKQLTLNPKGKVV